MNELLEKDDVLALDELVAGTIEPIAPPAAVKARLMGIIRDVPQNSHTVRADEGHWSRIPMSGVKMKLLTKDEARGMVTVLVDLAPGSSLPAHDHQGNEQSYVISGSCRIGGIALEQGDFHHAMGGTKHGKVVSDHGCVLLLIVDAEDYRAA
jgi:anti-sigma factor ChrR (cupin superfamily)